MKIISPLENKIMSEEDLLVLGGITERIIGAVLVIDVVDCNITENIQNYFRKSIPIIILFQSAS